MRAKRAKVERIRMATLPEKVEHMPEPAAAGRQKVRAKRAEDARVAKLPQRTEQVSEPADLKVAMKAAKVGKAGEVDHRRVRTLAEA